MKIKPQHFATISYIAEQGRKFIKKTDLETKVALVALAALSIIAFVTAYNKSYKSSDKWTSSKPQKSTESPPPAKATEPPLPSIQVNQVSKPTKATELSLSPIQVDLEKKKKEERLLLIKTAPAHIPPFIRDISKILPRRKKVIENMLKKPVQNPSTRLSQDGFIKVDKYIESFTKITSERFNSIERACLKNTGFSSVEGLNKIIQAFKAEGIRPKIDHPTDISNLIQITAEQVSLYEDLIQSLTNQFASESKLLLDIQKKYHEGIYPCEVNEIGSTDDTFLIINNKKDLENLINCYENYLKKIDNLMNNDENENISLNKILSYLSILKNNLENIKSKEGKK